MAITKTTTPPYPASPYAGYPYPYTRDHDDPRYPGVPHRPKIVAEGIPLTFARCKAYYKYQSEQRRFREWYGAHQKEIDSIVNNEPPHPTEAKQWPQQSKDAMRFYRRCCWERNAYPIESVHVDSLWYGDKKGKGRAVEEDEEKVGKVIPGYTLKCHRCSDHDRSNEKEEIRPHPDQEWWCATCDSEGKVKDDWDPKWWSADHEYWFGSDIEACVEVLEQPEPEPEAEPEPEPTVLTAPSTKSTESARKGRRDSALGNMLSRVKSVIKRSQ